MKGKMFYICPHCGNLFGIVNDAGVTPKCCGSDMEVLEANTRDGAREKHLPVVKVEGNICTVTVGEVLHPMSEAHHIAWVVVVTNLGRHRIILDHEGEPVAKVALNENEKVLRVYEYCNLHGLYVTELE